MMIRILYLITSTILYSSTFNIVPVDSFIVSNEWDNKDQNTNHLYRSLTGFLIQLVTDDNMNRFTDEELRLMILAVTMTQKISGSSKLFDGTSYSNHFIGVGSAALLTGLPAKYVIVALLHSLYLHRWPTEVTGDSTRDCVKRLYFREHFGSDIEDTLYRWVTTFGNGPWHTCGPTWVDMMNAGHFDQEDLMLLKVTLCDEVDEAISGDLWFSHNWKRRSEKFENSLLELARRSNNTIVYDLLHLSNSAVRSVYAHTGPPLPKDMTTTEDELFYKNPPPNYNLLNGNEKLIANIKKVITLSLPSKTHGLESYPQASLHIRK